jgi:Domain of unknown function (DUF6457)
MDAWVTKAAEAIGIDQALRPDEVETILDLARIAAHESGDRTNAPLLCYLVGLAAARTGRSVNELASLVRTSTS